MLVKICLMVKEKLVKTKSQCIASCGNVQDLDRCAYVSEQLYLCLCNVSDIICDSTLHPVHSNVYLICI